LPISKVSIRPVFWKEVNVIGKLIDQCSTKIEIKVDGFITEIEMEDILYIQSDNVHIEIYTTRTKYLIRERLQTFQELLNPAIFFRVHRSFIVNKMLLQKERKTNC